MSRCNSYYGNFRQKKFSDLWSRSIDFVNDYKNSDLAPDTNKITDASATTLFYLLYSEYGNSVIASSDTHQFKYQIFSTIFEYGPAWEKKLALQKELRDLTTEQIAEGAFAVHNHAFNPSTEVTSGTSSVEEIKYINDQNTTRYKKGKLDAYANLLVLIDNDVTKDFITKFKRYFLQIVMPEEPLWYVTEGDENDG